MYTNSFKIFYKNKEPQARLLETLITVTQLWMLTHPQSSRPHFR